MEIFFTLQQSIRRWLVLFVICLVGSGVTAFPVETELRWVLSWWPEQGSSFYQWLHTCYEAISDTNRSYPYLAYGYDWLAFAHIVIAVAFIGPLKDPVRNKWVIEFGMIACCMIPALAFVAGAIREVPLYWRWIDCSFGVLGVVPLVICYRKILQLEKINHH